MTKKKFYYPQRVDKTVAEQGVWFDVYDKSDNYHGSFKCRHMDVASPLHQVNVARALRIHAEKLRGNKKLENAVIMIENSITDWKLPVDPEDKSAKAEPYSKDSALEYFSDDDALFVLSELVQFVFDERNFKAVTARNEIEDVTGN